MGGNVGLRDGPSLWSKLKYLNISLVKWHKIVYTDDPQTVYPNDFGYDFGVNMLTLLLSSMRLTLVA